MLLALLFQVIPNKSHPSANRSLMSSPQRLIFGSRFALSGVRGRAKAGSAPGWVGLHRRAQGGAFSPLLSRVSQQAEPPPPAGLSTGVSFFRPLNCFDDYNMTPRMASHLFIMFAHDSLYYL